MTQARIMRQSFAALRASARHGDRAYEPRAGEAELDVVERDAPAADEAPVAAILALTPPPTVPDSDGRSRLSMLGEGSVTITVASPIVPKTKRFLGTCSQTEEEEAHETPYSFAT